MLVIEVLKGNSKRCLYEDKYYLDLDKSDFTIDMAYSVNMEEQFFIKFMVDNFNAKIAVVTSYYGHINKRMYFDIIDDANNASKWAESIQISQKMRGT